MLQRVGIALIVLTVMSVSSVIAGPSPPQPGVDRGWWSKSWEYVPVDSNEHTVADFVRRELSGMKSTVGGTLQLERRRAYGGLFQLKGRSAKSYAGDPEVAAQQFLTEHWTFITGEERKDEGRGLQFKPMESTRTRVRFLAYYEGVQIWGAGLAVNFDEDGYVVGVDFSPLLHVEMTEFPAPRPFEDIVAQLRALIRPDSSQVKGEHQLVIYPSDPPRVAYRCEVDIWVRIYDSRFIGPHLVDFYIDANTGEVLQTQGHVMRQVPLFPLSDDTTDYLGGGDHRDAKPAGPSLTPTEPYRDTAFRRLKPNDTTKPQSLNPSIESKQSGQSEKILPLCGNTKRPALSSRWPTIAKIREGLISRNASTITGYVQNVGIDLSQDIDSDSFYTRAFLVVDFNLDQQQSAEIVFDVCIRDTSGAEYCVGWLECETYYNQIDHAYIETIVPHSSRWDYTFAVYDKATTDVLAFLDYGDYAEDGSQTPLDARVEIEQHDKVYVPLASPGPPGVAFPVDQDEDGFISNGVLLYPIKILYDSLYGLRTRIYARNSNGDTLPPAYSSIVHMSPDSTFFLGANLFPYYDQPDEWDYRLAIDAVPDYGFDTIQLSEIHFGDAADWTDVGLENWIRDPDKNVIFRPNPVHSLNEPDLWDSSNASAAVPMAAYVSVTLPNLTSSTELIGQYARIVDSQYPWIPAPYSPSGVFPFLRGDEGFEAVMCYYWVNWSQTYLQNIGYSIYDTAISIDPYSQSHGAKNAFFESSGGLGYMGFGDAGTDAAEDAELILHEYCHALIFDLSSDVYFRGPDDGTNLTKAMNEGFADYWAASASAHFWPTGFEPAYWGEWWNRDAPSDQPYRRRLNTAKTYPADVSSSSYHQTGEIWSACLWEIMQDIGKVTMDSLVLESVRMVDSVFSLSGRPLFEHGALYLLRADSIHNGYAHREEILSVFQDRGILPCDCPYQADINADGIHDAIDLNLMIGVFFFNREEPHDPYCPLGRADVDGDGISDAIDLNTFIEYVFFNGPGPSDPCSAPSPMVSTRKLSSMSEGGY